MKNLKQLQNNYFYFILLILLTFKNNSSAQIIDLTECDIVNSIDNKNEFIFINLNDIKNEYIKKDKKLSKNLLKINNDLKVLFDCKNNFLIVTINKHEKKIFFNKKIDKIRYNGFFYSENSYELYFSIYQNKCLNYIGLSDNYKKWTITEFMSLE
jgi:hypothetical protein